MEQKSETVTIQPKKRPWFQYHLSTAVVLMFVASGIVGANFARQGQLAVVGFEPNGVSVPDPIIHKLPAYGWPFRFTAPAVSQYVNVEDQLLNATAWSGPTLLPIQSNQVNFPLLGADVAVGLTILVAVAVLLERPIRRRQHLQ